MAIILGAYVVGSRVGHDNGAARVGGESEAVEPHGAGPPVLVLVAAAVELLPGHPPAAVLLDDALDEPGALHPAPLDPGAL